jgi:hypothetical protein
VQDSILRYLRSTYPTAVVWKIHEDSVFGVVGIPDILFILDGETWFFEVKRVGEEATPLQKVVIKKLRLNRVPAYVVYSVDDVKEILNRQNA